MSTENKSPSIVRIPKVIWTDQLQPEIEAEQRLCSAGLYQVAESISSINVDEEDGNIGEFIDRIEDVRQYLNFIDQKLEIIGDLAQYLLKERSENNDNSN